MIKLRKEAIEELPARIVGGLHVSPGPLADDGRPSRTTRLPRSGSDPFDYALDLHRVPRLAPPGSVPFGVERSSITIGAKSAYASSVRALATSPARLDEH